MIDIGNKHVEELMKRYARVVEEMNKQLVAMRTVIDGFAADVALSSTLFEEEALKRLEQFKHGFAATPKPESSREPENESEVDRLPKATTPYLEGQAIDGSYERWAQAADGKLSDGENVRGDRG